MTKIKSRVCTPSGKIMMIFGIEVNILPRKVLLQIIEWQLNDKMYPQDNSGRLEQLLTTLAIYRGLTSDPSD